MATLWQRIKGLFSGGVATKSASGLLAGVMQSGTVARRGTRELLEAYRTHPWLHATVHRIATAVAGERFELFRSKKAGPKANAKMRQTKASMTYSPSDAVEVESHPLLELLESPCPAFTRSVFFQLLQAYLELKGEVFLVVERAANGLPVELWVVPPHWLLEQPHTGFASYRFQFGSWMRTVPEDDVIALRHPELVQPYARGVGYGESLADELDIDEFATQHLKSWFFNRALPDVFLSVEGLESREQAREYEQMLRQKHGGRDKVGQVHVTNGKVELKQVGHTFREQMLPELRTQERDIVLQVFGMPPEMMGIVENSNRATIEAATLIFTKFVLTPRLAFIADVLTHWARIEYRDAGLCLGFDSPIPEDHEFELKVMAAKPTLFTKNEWRRLAGAEPVDGWDEEFPEETVASPFGDPAEPTQPKPRPEDAEPDVADEDDVVDGERGLLRLIGGD